MYLALFALTLLAVIAGSGALMAIAGLGREVMLFCMGVGAGMALVLAFSVELWKLARDQLAVMQTQVADVVLALRLGEINPRLVLGATPSHASDVVLELECRRLLDRVRQLLEKAVDADGRCRYCEQWNTHTDSCPVAAAEALYRAGKAKRVPWREYKKRLSQDVR
ncbi:MAG: hypothetical protein AAGN15_23825 [Cyanobacteria bacterium J06581_3]